MVDHPQGFPQPVDGSVVPRFAGPASFMRLPTVTSPAELDIALIGVPWDGGTTNRPGARHGPREIRNQSSLMRRAHHVSKIVPYELARIADLGDVPLNPIDLMGALATIEAYYQTVRAAGAIPLSAGGDHLTTLPILLALGRDRPLGLVHFDAHSDTNDRYFGDNLYTHGTPFRRAIEAGVLDPKRTIQIGIRSALYDAEEHRWAKDVGIRIVYIEEFGERGAAEIAAEARKIVGDGATYLSFDIDCLDPAFAPGTGTPEIGGLTTREAQATLRLLRGIDFIGADVVEVAPPFDPSGTTALVGATMMFEILCLLADRVAARRS